MHSSAPAGGTRCARRSSRASSAASAPSSPTAGEFPFPAECPECNATGETETELDLLPPIRFYAITFAFPSSPGRYYNAYCSMTDTGYIWTQPNWDWGA